MKSDRGATDSQRPVSLMGFLFGLQGRVGRGTYARWGFGLMLAKFAIDTLVLRFALDRSWTPIDYLNPVLSQRLGDLNGAGGLSSWFPVALALWTIPFCWVGVTLTMKRAHDAGLSPWFALPFFVPYLNYVVMLGLCLVPSSPTSARSQVESSGFDPVLSDAYGTFRNALLALGASTAVTLLNVLAMAQGLASYGYSLFFLVPFLLGSIAGFLYNRPHQQSVLGTLAMVTLSLLISGAFLLLIALEGFICIAMIVPLAWPVAAFGGLFGRAVAELTQSGPTTATSFAPAALALIASPILAAIEARLDLSATYEAVSCIEIDAPPAVVWDHVVSFSELPEPTWLPFRLGIAYPVRAVIDGSGVGAVRRCEFSTGAFVEPITVWDAPRRLAFDVIEHPPPMHEWSPYRSLEPPHLARSFRSLRGEFRLVELPGGRTRLEGSTWYELRLFPLSYWHVWSDLLVTRIHERVLDQIRREAETT